MDTSPVVSVVIPTYNRANDLKRALNSVQAQTFTNWEVLVVDNYSEDNTDEIIASFNDPRIKLFKIHNNGVIAASRNMGIREARGEYIAFLDSDDWWMSDKLRLSVDAMNAGFDVVYHDLFIINKLSQELRTKVTKSRKLKSPILKDLLFKGNCLSNSSVVVRKLLLQKIGGLAEEDDLIGCEDFDLWLRLSQLTEKFRRIPFVLGCYWVGGGNLSSHKRTISNIDAIEARYSTFIHKFGINSNDSAWWLEYARARAYYLSRNITSAKKQLKKITFGKAPFLVYVKSKWMSIVVKFL
jgi:glycosyltransferase involved in cell wall biosynthesis